MEYIFCKLIICDATLAALCTIYTYIDENVENENLPKSKVAVLNGSFEIFGKQKIVFGIAKK